MAVGHENKILLHDLQNGGEPKVIYEHEDTEAAFTFELMSEGTELIIFEESKISILDMEKDNALIAEISKETLGVGEIYPQKLFGDYKTKTFRAYLVDEEDSLLIMTVEKIHLLDISDIYGDEGKIEIQASANLAKKKYTRNHHCYVNEEKGIVYISQRNKAQKFFYWEMDLATLKYKRDIGPGQKFNGHFYFAEE